MTQAELTGFERPKIEFVDKAAEKVRELQAERAEVATMITAAESVLLGNLERAVEEGLLSWQVDDGERVVKYSYYAAGEQRQVVHRLKNQLKIKLDKSFEGGDKLDDGRGQPVPKPKRQKKPVERLPPKKKVKVSK